jgi:hypothetical protein
MRLKVSSLTPRIAFAAWWAAFAVGVYAHDLGRSESIVTVTGSDVRLRLTLNLLEVAAIDLNGDGQVSYGELDEAIERIYAIVKAHLIIRGTDPPVRTSLQHYSVTEGHAGQLDLLLTFERKLNHLTVTSTLHQVLRPTHEHMTTVSFDGTEGLHRAMLSVGMPGTTFAQGSDPYLATIVLGLLVGTVIGCTLLVRFVRRRFIR